MPDFDELKNDAENYAKEHPEQVQKGKDAVEDKLGIQQGGNQQDQDGKDDSGNQGQ